MTWRERRLAKKIRRAEDDLADLEEYDWKWSWSDRPSERRRTRERIEKAQTRLDALLVLSGEVPDDHE